MKKLIVVIGISLMSITAFSQDRNQMIFGGAVSVDFGRFNDRVEVTPTLHTQIIPKLYLGVGATFAYYKQESLSYIPEEQGSGFRTYETTYTTYYYGGNLFARFYPLEHQRGLVKNIFLQTEFEYLKGNGNYKDETGKYKFDTNNKTVFAGIGYKHQVWKNTALTASIFFKLNNENDSPYRNPIIRIGFEF